MQIGALAEAVGVSVDAVRLYERRGLIRSDRRANGYRDFPEAALVALRLIRQAQALGFSLAEIGEVLAGLNGSLAADEVRALLQSRIERLDRQVAELTTLRGLLQTRLEAACAFGLDRR